MSEKINPRSVSIGTTTFYKNWEPGEVDLTNIDKVRGDEAIEFAREAKERGYPLTVVDGGSPKLFVETLQALGVLVFPQEEPGMGPGRRQALMIASQAPSAEAIIWAEPEKGSFIADCLEMACQPILGDSADMVVPRRNRYLFRTTYPSFQVQSEDWANDGINNILLREFDQVTYLDILFGPKVFRNDPKRLGFFMRKYRYHLREGLSDSGVARAKGLNSELWAGICALPVVAALHEEYVVQSVDVPFRYPQVQKRAEQVASLASVMEEKRMNQLRNMIILVLEYVRLLKGDPRSRLEQIT
ncbi:hypothetical protein A3B39_05480 [Candidatus Daviesbacteria bacterium RIFCSPLOWO2_01_FULL_37_10]|nr:MAG: hypothetical protein A3B39_05480 [Candidatus Daviesbacteria bacterium RIFCSPLOWO2_01_FULL_37_10]